MARGPEGVRIAILATDGVERVELEQPRGALYGTGATSDLLSIHPGEIQARQFDIVADHRRSPADLAAFCPATVEQFTGARLPE